MQNFKFKNKNLLQKIFSEHGDIHALVGTEIPLYVYGKELTNGTEVVFTSGRLWLVVNELK